MDLTRLEPRMLRPLNPSLRGIACSMCDKAGASWWADVPLSEDGRVCICSLCVVYETEWAKKEHAHIDKMLVEVEKARGEEFERGADRRLSRASQMDHVLGVVVLMERVRGVKGLTDSLRKPEE